MKETHLLAGWGRIGNLGLLFLASMVWLACSSQPETARTSAPPEAPPASPQPVSSVAGASGNAIEKSFGPIKAKVPAAKVRQGSASIRGPYPTRHHAVDS